MLTFDNSVYGNKPYPEKRGHLKAEKPCYATSSVFMERKVAQDFDNWNKESLLDRTKQIKEWALKRWKIEQAGPLIVGAETEDEEEVGGMPQ